MPKLVCVSVENMFEDALTVGREYEFRSAVDDYDNSLCYVITNNVGHEHWFTVEPDANGVSYKDWFEIIK